MILKGELRNKITDSTFKAKETLCLYAKILEVSLKELNKLKSATGLFQRKQKSRNGFNCNILF